MKTHRDLLRFTGFTLVELLVAMAATIILAGIILPVLPRRQVDHSRIRCVNNLKQVGLAFRIWAGDNNDFFPMQVTIPNSGTAEVATDVWRTFQLMSNELGSARMIICRADFDRAEVKEWTDLSNSNFSFFIGLDANESSPQMVLAGDRNVTNGWPTTNRVLTVPKGSRIGWTHLLHNNQGNVALADGSVLQFTSGKLQAHFRKDTNAVQRFAMPE